MGLAGGPQGLRRAGEFVGCWMFLKTESEKNFQKVLDDAAKADQNLASLLLTTKANAIV